MSKDFDSWNGEKKNLEQIGHNNLVFHEREIWWCSIGVNLGDEQDGLDTTDEYQTENRDLLSQFGIRWGNLQCNFISTPFIER